MQEMQASEGAAKFLEGLDYPIAKSELVVEARDSNVAASVQEALEKLPEREYRDADDVTRELNAAP
jgi:hypothetical protein